MVTPEPGSCYLLSADSCLACPPADDAPKEAGMADAAAVAGPAAPIPTAATSAAASVLDEVLAANKAYLSSGQHTPDMPLGVSRRLAVVTCMDSRCGRRIAQADAPPPGGAAGREGGVGHDCRKCSARSVLFPSCSSGKLPQGLLHAASWRWEAPVPGCH